MPGIDAVLENLKHNVAVAAAPYQPNQPPLYPNPDPRAGTILPTLFGRGHPIQYHVLTRLENHMAQVAFFLGKGERLYSYLDRTIPTISTPVAGPPGAKSYLSQYTVGRSIRTVVVEIWAPTIDDRQHLSDVVRSVMTDAYRQTESDGTVSLFRFRDQVDIDDEEQDTIYVRQLHYDCDFEVTQEFATTVVEETKLDLAVDPSLAIPPPGNGC